MDNGRIENLLAWASAALFVVTGIFFIVDPQRAIVSALLTIAVEISSPPYSKSAPHPLDDREAR